MGQNLQFIVPLNSHFLVKLLVTTDNILQK